VIVLVAVLVREARFSNTRDGDEDEDDHEDEDG
jgi:hypothetical protein